MINLEIHIKYKINESRRMSGSKEARKEAEEIKT